MLRSGELARGRSVSRALVKERCCDEDSVMAALLKSTESAVRAIRALQSELFATNACSPTVKWTRTRGFEAGSCVR